MDKGDLPTVSDGCASVVHFDFYGRNYGWNYDDEVYFIIKTSVKNGPHAVLGVSGAFLNIS